MFKKDKHKESTNEKGKKGEKESRTNAREMFERIYKYDAIGVQCKLTGSAICLFSQQCQGERSTERLPSTISQSVPFLFFSTSLREYFR